jgi:hypothetical protein
MKRAFCLIIFCCANLLGCAPQYVIDGYVSPADYEFSKQFDNATPAIVAELKKYHITSRQALDAIVREMDSVQYSRDNSHYETVFEYLMDKSTADSKNMTPAEQRKVRLAQQEAEAQRQAQQYAKEFPYKLVVTCEIQGQNIGIEPCFIGSRHGINTQLEIRNGNEYGMYQPWDLQRLGDSRGEGLVIQLREKFTVKGQNSSNTLLLTFKVFDTATGGLLFIESAPFYRTIAVSK